MLWALVTLLLALLSGSTAPARAPQQTRPPTSQSSQPQGQSPKPRVWADWVEPDFPFFSSVLDARHAGAGFPTNNLTPRALVLNLGGGCWAGFDTDLLRVAAMWCGHGVTPKALAPGSYNEPDRKTPGGQSPAPEPDGQVWLANGIYPGWQTGERLSLEDPREPAPSVEEVGRGPLPEEVGRFKAIRLVRGGAVLEYTAGGAEVREWITRGARNGMSSLVRQFQVGPSSEPLWLVLGVGANDTAVSLSGWPGAQVVTERLSITSASQTLAAGSVWAVRVLAHKDPVEFCAAFTNGGLAQVNAP